MKGFNNAGNYFQIGIYGLLIWHFGNSFSINSRCLKHSYNQWLSNIDTHNRQQIAISFYCSYFIDIDKIKYQDFVMIYYRLLKGKFNYIKILTTVIYLIKILKFSMAKGCWIPFLTERTVQESATHNNTVISLNLAIKETFSLLILTALSLYNYCDTYVQ